MTDSKVAVRTVRKAPKAESTPIALPATKGTPSPEQMHQLIAVTAYYLAERRNFEAGHELEDWLAAEAQIQADVESCKGFPA